MEIFGKLYYNITALQVEIIFLIHYCIHIAFQSIWPICTQMWLLYNWIELVVFKGSNSGRPVKGEFHM